MIFFHGAYDVLIVIDVIKKKGLASLQTLSCSGSQGGIRTPDMVVNSHPLCQLSYLGIVSNKRSVCLIQTDIVYSKVNQFLSMNRSSLTTLLCQYPRVSLLP
jgi:hypothetical protein